MKVLQGKGKAQPSREARQRNGLLAMVHIAIKELGIPEADYRAILKWQFNKRSAAHLSMLELQYLVDYFKGKGWQNKRRRTTDNKRQMTDNGPQCEALRERIWEVARGMENGDRRLRGLSKKFLKVDCLVWCREAGKLKRLLAALERILAADLRK